MPNPNPDLLSLQTQPEVQILSCTPISDLEPIEKNRNSVPLSRDMLTELVEFPLLKPCQTLWDKGIRTLATSANKKDLQSGYAYLIIEWDALSEENQAIARACATRIISSEDEAVYLSYPKDRVVLVDPQPHYDGEGFVEIAVPLNKQTTVSDVENSVSEIIEKFKKQPATWVDKYSYSLEDLKRRYDIREGDGVNLSDIIKRSFYYDEKSKRFFRSKDLIELKYRQ